MPARLGPPSDRAPLDERILNAANDEDREQAEYEMAQFIKQHYRPEPRDFKMDQAHDEQT